MTADPLWLQIARTNIGERETLGPNDSPWIRAMLKRLRASWLLGQPWCGGACAEWLGKAGHAIPAHWYRAKAWATWGQHLDRPVHGCIVVFERSGGGHVGLVVGEDAVGNLLVLGGNQGDAVNVRAFQRGRVIAYRWPAGVTLPAFAQLAQGSAAATTGEA